jgi:hypothetical protein
MRKVSLIGNSLAYLLCQEQKCATADVRVISNRRPDIRPQGQFGSSARPTSDSTTSRPSLPAAA